MFTEILAQSGIQVTDRSEAADTPLIDRALGGTTEHYQIEFLLCPSDEAAIAIFEENKNKMKTGTGTHSGTNLKNYSKYQLSVGDKFYYVARIQNTVLFINAYSDYKDEVMQLVKQMGY